MKETILWRYLDKTKGALNRDEGSFRIFSLKIALTFNNFSSFKIGSVCALYLPRLSFLLSFAPLLFYHTGSFTQLYNSSSLIILMKCKLEF